MLRGFLDSHLFGMTLIMKKNIGSDPKRIGFPRCVESIVLHEAHHDIDQEVSWRAGLKRLTHDLCLLGNRGLIICLQFRKTYGNTFNARSLNTQSCSEAPKRLDWRVDDGWDTLPCSGHDLSWPDLVRVAGGRRFPNYALRD